jgi:hypothetical protein
MQPALCISNSPRSYDAKGAQQRTMVSGRDCSGIQSDSGSSWFEVFALSVGDDGNDGRGRGRFRLLEYETQIATTTASGSCGCGRTTANGEARTADLPMKVRVDVRSLNSDQRAFVVGGEKLLYKSRKKPRHYCQSGSTRIPNSGESDAEMSV